jgi:hypothetical protein
MYYNIIYNKYKRSMMLKFIINNIIYGIPFVSRVV